MSPYEAGWRDGYNGRPMARHDLSYGAGWRDGQAEQIRCSEILADAGIRP